MALGVRCNTPFSPRVLTLGGKLSCPCEKHATLLVRPLSEEKTCSVRNNHKQLVIIDMVRHSQTHQAQASCCLVFVNSFRLIIQTIKGHIETQTSHLAIKFFSSKHRNSCHTPSLALLRLDISPSMSRS